MKKIALMIALVYLLTGLCGCMPEQPQADGTTPPPPTSTGAPEITTQPQPTTTGSVEQPPVPPAIVLSEIPMSSLSSPVVQETFRAEDGTELLHYTYQNIFPIHQDSSVAEAISLALLNDLDRSADLQQVLQAARDQYAQSPASWKPYTCQVLFNTMRIDQNILSIYGNISLTTTESSSSPFSASYSLVNGKKLTYRDIISESYSYYTMFQLIDKQLKESDVKDQLVPEYDAIILSQLRNDCTNWYFSGNGLCFYFSPYEVSQKVAGVVEVEIPYSELTGQIKDAYFPAEEYTTGGALQVNLFSQANLFDFQSFAEVIQDTSGEEVLLFTDGTITDIHLEIGSWNEDGTLFTPTATIFACDGIWKSTAILLQIQFPDVMPIVRVSYNSDGVSYSKLITQSGMDGSILLID